RRAGRSAVQDRPPTPRLRSGTSDRSYELPSVPPSPPHRPANRAGAPRSAQSVAPDVAKAWSSSGAPDPQRGSCPTSRPASIPRARPEPSPVPGASGSTKRELDGRCSTSGSRRGGESPRQGLLGLGENLTERDPRAHPLPQLAEPPRDHVQRVPGIVEDGQVVDDDGR